MLKRSQRISRKDLLSTHAPFSFYKTPHFVLKARKNSLNHLRFGFIISKKIDKRAVVRNALKRRLVHVLETIPHPPKGYDVVFSVKKELAALSQEQLAHVIAQALKKQLV